MASLPPHDLLLGTLIDLFPDDIRNYRFEADITDNELTFSYTLAPRYRPEYERLLPDEKNGDCRCRLIPTTVKVKSNSLTDYAVLHFSRKVDTATASLPV